MVVAPKATLSANLKGMNRFAEVAAGIDSFVGFGQGLCLRVLASNKCRANGRQVLGFAAKAPKL